MPPSTKKKRVSFFFFFFFVFFCLRARVVVVSPLLSASAIHLFNSLENSPAPLRDDSQTTHADTYLMHLRLVYLAIGHESSFFFLFHLFLSDWKRGGVDIYLDEKEKSVDDDSFLFHRVPAALCVASPSP